METSRIEKAIYVIKHIIAKAINENTEKDYKKFREKIQKLKEEQHEIYMGNEEIINKVLTKYVEEIRK